MTPDEADKIIGRITLLYDQEWRGKTVGEMTPEDRAAALKDVQEAYTVSQSMYRDRSRTPEERRLSHEAVVRNEARIKELQGDVVNSQIRC